MAERILSSPGVFDREIDQTSRPADTVGVGPVFIGPRVKGPAMTPVRVKDLDTDQTIFGLPDPDGLDFGAYVNRTYFKAGPSAPSHFVRLLGMSDTGVTPGFTVGGIYVIGASGATSNVQAVILTSGTTTVSLGGTLTSSVDQLSISISNGGGDFTASLNRNDVNYIKKVLNTDPTQFATAKVLVYQVFNYASKTPAVSNTFFAAQVQGPATAFTDEFITGSSGLIISQPFGSVEYDLFGVGNIFAGESANSEVKISITNIKKSPNPDQNEFGTFTLLVRQFLDNDRAPVVLESFSNLDLNPSSPNYICRRIGDQYKVWNKTTKKFDVFGDYPNKSTYIYINPTANLKNGVLPKTSLPWGFKGVRKLASGCIANKAVFPDTPVVNNLLYKTDFNTKVFWGAQIINNASGALNYGVIDRMKHLPKSLMAVSGTVDGLFSLKYVSASVGSVSGFATTTRLTDSNILSLSTSLQYNTGSSVPSLSSSQGFTGYLSVDNIENTVLAKFTLPVYDGFDGVDITKVDPFSSEDMNSVTSYQTYAYRTAVDMLSNRDDFEFTELSIPGIYNSKVTDYALNMVEERNDMFYIMDVSGTTVSDVISDVTNKLLDSSFAACYYPSVKLFDDANNKFVTVPPSVVIPAVFAFTDKVSFPWFAPGGMSRGGLKSFGVTEAKDKLTKTERDRLYENRVNPIATFPQEGVVVWGQKTLQIKGSALDRINVRRMLLRVRREINMIARTVVFEPNVAATWGKFVNKLNPYLSIVKQNSGVDDFKVILDERTTTQDLIDRNIMYAKIAIRPTRAAEYILIDIDITNTVGGLR